MDFKVTKNEENYFFEALDTEQICHYMNNLSTEVGNIIEVKKRFKF